MRSLSTSRRASRAFAFASGLLLAIGSLSLVSAAPERSAGEAATAARFRNIFGLPSASDAFANTPASSTAMAKYGVDLTAAEEADLDARSKLQEQLGGVEAIVLKNGARVGGMWLDQHSSLGHGFIVMIAFVDSVDEGLLKDINSAAPVGTTIQAVVVARSAAQLDELAAAAQEAAGDDTNINGVSIAPQDNAVVIHSADGSLPAALAGVAGYEVVQETVTPAGCTSAYRCTTRPYRAGMEIQDQYGSSPNYGWEECTSGFAVKRSNGAHSLLTAAHCQYDYSGSNVYTMNQANTTIEQLGTWGADTVPPHGTSCLTVCDMNVEVQLINSLVLSLPSAIDSVLYSSTDTLHDINSYSSWSSTWVGKSVCAIGVSSNLSCGTIQSVGYVVIDMHKETYYARVNKAAYAYLANPIQDGDSGGPVLNGSVGYGINTAKTDNGQDIFSSLSYALSELGVTLCTTDAC